jgi:ribose 5-phosphate isomerase B
MIMAFACDHGWFPFRESILEHLRKLWHEVIDLWPQTEEPLDDFPDYSRIVCESIVTGKAERGVLVCGTGVGMSMAANKHHSIRAVLAYNSEIAKISRSHNDANVICFGARTMNIDDAISSLDAFLETEFLWGKYQRRNEKMDSIC